ncbi:MAG TPA: hypothetical protein VFB72_11815, partial [Verrucomicrobiae bacterium]|nr:hypothetical protein [Verrucomicrobiae bacterium]
RGLNIPFFQPNWGLESPQNPQTGMSALRFRGKKFLSNALLNSLPFGETPNGARGTRALRKSYLNSILSPQTKIFSREQLGSPRANECFLTSSLKPEPRSVF